MKFKRTITLTAALGVALAGSVLAQRGPRGSGAGFGMRSWVLYENGVDSLAERIDLTDEQRDRIEALAHEFHNDNADAIERMTRMRAEIDALRTEDQRPTREAIARIAEEHGYPERDLRPALNQLHEDMAEIVTVQQQRQLQRSPPAGSIGGRGAMAGRGYRSPRAFQRGGRVMRGYPRFGGQRLRLHRIPPPDSQP